jgi:transcriptional regulator with XRE-family HTH domain
MATKRGRPARTRFVTPSAERVPVGFALAALRQPSGMAQEDVARRLGVTRAQVSYYESGKTVPSYFRLRSYLDCLGRDLRDLQETLDEIEKRPPATRRPGQSRVLREEALLAEAEALFRTWQSRLPARQQPALVRAEAEVMRSLRRLLVEIGAREAAE